MLGIQIPGRIQGRQQHHAAMKAMIDGLVADLNKQFEVMKEQFVHLDNRLKNIEQGGQTDEAAAAAQAQRECKAAANTLEANAKRGMEAAGRSSLKEQKETATSSVIPEIADEVASKLFDATNKEEVPKTTLPPPYPYPGTPSGSFTVLTPRIHKLVYIVCMVPKGLVFTYILWQRNQIQQEV